MMLMTLFEVAFGSETFAFAGRFVFFRFASMISSSLSWTGSDTSLLSQ